MDQISPQQLPLMPHSTAPSEVTMHQHGKEFRSLEFPVKAQVDGVTVQFARGRDRRMVNKKEFPAFLEEIVHALDNEKDMIPPDEVEEINVDWIAEHRYVGVFLFQALEDKKHLLQSIPWDVASDEGIFLLPALDPISMPEMPVTIDITLTAVFPASLGWEPLEELVAFQVVPGPPKRADFSCTEEFKQPSSKGKSKSKSKSKPLTVTLGRKMSEIIERVFYRILVGPGIS